MTIPLALLASSDTLRRPFLSNEEAMKISNALTRTCLPAYSSIEYYSYLLEVSLPFP